MKHLAVRVHLHPPHEGGGVGRAAPPIDRARLEVHDRRGLRLGPCRRAEGGGVEAGPPEVREPHGGVPPIGHRDVESAHEGRVGELRVVRLALHRPRDPLLARVLGGEGHPPERRDVEDHGRRPREAGPVTAELACPPAVRQGGVAHPGEQAIVEEHEGMLARGRRRPGGRDHLSAVAGGRPSARTRARPGAAGHQCLGCLAPYRRARTRRWTGARPPHRPAASRRRGIS